MATYRWILCQVVILCVQPEPKLSVVGFTDCAEPDLYLFTSSFSTELGVCLLPEPAIITRREQRIPALGTPALHQVTKSVSPGV